jgi:ABC-type glycerol-3-phosphate transport system permease component
MTISWLHLVNTYWAIILPSFGMTLGLYLMKQFMEQVPDSLLEAAKIDGASEYRIFWQIVMPIVKPAWLTLVIFSLQNLWTNGSVTSHKYIYSEQLKTVDYVFGQIASGGLVRTGPVSAVTLLMMAVPITVFIVTQSNIIQTMSTSGLKE